MLMQVTDDSPGVRKVLPHVFVETVDEKGHHSLLGEPCNIVQLLLLQFDLFIYR